MYSYATLDYSRGYRDENGQWETEYGEIKYRCENCNNGGLLVTRFYGTIIYAPFAYFFYEFIEVDH